MSLLAVFAEAISAWTAQMYIMCRASRRETAAVTPTEGLPRSDILFGLLSILPEASSLREDG